MKRSTVLFPLMAMTALSLSLAACDDNDADKAAPVAVEEQDTMSEMVSPPDELDTSPAAMPLPVSGTVEAGGAIAYATAPDARTGAIFVTLNNTGSTDDVLMGVASDRATMAELHEGYVDESDGTMQMRKAAGVPVAAGQSVELKPGGLHIMLIDLIAPLVEGETFSVTLQFENAGDVVVPVTVTAPGASAAPMDDHHDMTGDDLSLDATDEPVVEDVPADEPMTDVMPDSDEQPIE